MNSILPYLVLVAEALVPASETGIPKMNDQQTLSNIILLAHGMAAVVAVVIIIIAGIKLTISRGTPQQVASARNMIVGAVIGLIVILFSVTIISFIRENV